MTITLRTALPELYNDLCEVIRLFYGECEIHEDADGEICIVHSVEDEKHVVRVENVEKTAPLTPVGEDELENKRLCKRAVKNTVYAALKELTGKRIPWGSLTGIRPTRLFYEQLAAGLDEEAACRALMEKFDVSREKAELLRDIARVQRGMEQPKAGEIDVYVGIPFCRTRCSYCSFAAVDLKHGGKLTDGYVEAVTREMQLVRGDWSQYKVRGLYIGGGTPTALTCAQLDRVIGTALECFPGAREFTVEAGRPDTLDDEKLRMLRAHGVDRVSLNPQTMNDETLRRVGRDHTAEDIRRMYDEMHGMGFSVINMDLILGLPGETAEDVARTLDAIAELTPENLTVHTLAIKRAAALRQTGYHADEEEAMRMVELAAHRAREMGYQPYYLYRQKYMAGNLENVGYCKPGTASIYNVDIMEEIMPIAAFGAGAISKWLYPAARRIERAPNVKNIEQYIARVDEMAERKRALWNEEGK